MAQAKKSKKVQIPDDVELEKMNLDPIDLDTHELDIVEQGATAEEAMENAGEEANDKAEGQDEK